MFLSYLEGGYKMYKSRIFILDKNFNFLTFIEDAWDTTVDMAINETYSFKFNISQTSPNCEYIKEGHFVEVHDQLFEIETMNLVRDRSRILSVTCQHVFWGLEKEFWENDFEVVDSIEWRPEMKLMQSEFYTHGENIWLCLETHMAGQFFDETKFRNVTHLENNYMPATTPYEVLIRLLKNTPYQVIPSDIEFTPTDFTLKRGDILKNIKEVQKNWGGEWEWNNFNVRLVEKIGEDNGATFEYGVNNMQVTRDIDARDVITRLYVTGKNGLTLENLTGGYQYIDAEPEIFNKYNRPKAGDVVFTDVEDENILMVKAREHLETVKLPNTTYSLTVAELKFLQGYEDYYFTLGDVVNVVDTELFGEPIRTRVVNYSFNPFYPKESNVVLNNKDKTLITIFNALKEKQEDDKQELIEMIENIPKDTSVVNKIVETTYHQVVTIETAHILNAWIKSLYVDRVETNIDSILKNSPMFTPDRNFIVMEDQHIKFISQDLLKDEFEDLLIPNPDSITGGMVYVYWTAIGEDKDAYKYFTITPPSVMMPDKIYPNSDEELAFRVKVHKKVNEDISLRIFFEDGGNNRPIIEWGKSMNNDPQDARGKSYMYKDDDGMEINYYTKNNAVKRQLRIDEEGVHVNNTQTPLGKPVVRNIIVSHNQPDNTTGKDGDIWFVLKS